MVSLVAVVFFMIDLLPQIYVEISFDDAFLSTKARAMHHEYRGN